MLEVLLALLGAVLPLLLILNSKQYQNPVKNSLCPQERQKTSKLSPQDLWHARTGGPVRGGGGNGTR